MNSRSFSDISASRGMTLRMGGMMISTALTKLQFHMFELTFYEESHFKVVLE